ncbi:hypothetical protein BJ875DRAFT_211778 [Amylocarpus encephaloides]|uniref:Uncharacterized protein n=1 Tax=Amylocarpus encephaloides TaxID=45428 RepID=A0A9P7Y947_9HELO|nr:hypothetical protein BJ875DRAFT_211778 [Amylocarpus encephaloides]
MYQAGFKECVISAAILIGFGINIAFVDHPNVVSYTAAFVVSLILLSPIVIWYKNRKASVGQKDNGATPMRPLARTRSAMSISVGVKPEADVGKGLVQVPQEDEQGRSKP